MIKSDLTNVQCPICADFMSSTGIKLYDDRYGYPGNYIAYRCDKCDHISLSAKFTAEQLTDLYSNYYPRADLKVEDHIIPKEESGLASWLQGVRCKAFRWVPKSVRVLDIGCGFGETLGYHRARGCEVFGVETDKNILRVASVFGYNVKVGLFDSNDYPQSYFDYVTMDQVIEHVTDPNSILCGVEKILKTGGVAILTTPNVSGWGAKLFGKYWINWHAPYHLHLFSEKSIQISAEKAGLVLESCRTITSSDWLYYQWIHILTFPSEMSASEFWSPRHGLSMKVKIILYFLRIIHKFGINHIITRFFDMLKVGDSKIYFLRKP